MDDRQRRGRDMSAGDPSNFAPQAMTMLMHAEKISFAYGDRAVLGDISAELRAGEIVAVLGPNGCGKTTLLKLLLALLHGQGTIAWDGKDLRKWSRRELARRVAYLPQSPTCDPAQTVADVLRLGRAPYLTMLGLESAKDVEIVTQVAELLDLSGMLSTPINSLSGGQRQRVFIGRCLVQEPAALLLDEPDTFLDLRHQAGLYTLLRKLAKDKNVGVLLASHDLNLAAAYADRLILLGEGRVVASGSASDVLQPELIEKTYGVAMERIDRDGRISVLPIA